MQSLFAQTKAPTPFGPIPTENQMRWQEMEYYAFVHFSINTYTNEAWGYGDEDINLFNPEELDCRQWARICKEAGMKGIIVTAKHHSGFCLWPSKYTEYSVKKSPWKDGKGDVVKELADACKEYGLKLGIYLSPWDRNAASYGSPEYITYFRNQLTELLTNYGDVFEVWFDGANGGTGYYGGARENRKIDRTVYYDWKNTYDLIRKLQPKIVIWNDGGDRADLRWVGTESGYVGETNWSLLNATGEVPEDMLRHGVEDGDSWVPGEVNTSIRPEWFYHPDEDARVKKLPKLLDTYYESIGRNGTLLLNFPIMPNGLIHENDEKEIQQMTKVVKEDFAINLAKKTNLQASNVRGKTSQFKASKLIDNEDDTYWSTDDNVTQASVTMDFKNPTTFNRFLIQEHIKLGQRVKAFKVEALINGQWKELAVETTIGYKRILRLQTVTATKMRFTILDSKAAPTISNMGVYYANQVLGVPKIVRKKSGEIHMTPADKESLVFYTTDGQKPTINSTKYTGPISPDGKVNIRAIAYDAVTKKVSDEQDSNFDISKKDWEILNIDDAKSNEIIDGESQSMWFQKKNAVFPVDLVIDLGKAYNVSGFTYLPNQVWHYGIISNYKFFISNDNLEWTLVNEGEFSNIKNNPVLQIKTFSNVNARFVKFQALSNTVADQPVGYAEFDVITD